MNQKTLLILLATFLISVVSFSHSGRTDSNGCHTNRKTGEYHCHGKKSSSSSSRNRTSGKTANTASNVKKSSNSGSLYFSNCTEARSRGYSNIKRGEAGYASHLDRDKDGIACETR